MAWQFNPYVIPLFIGIVPLFGFAYFGWQRGSGLDVKLFYMNALSTAFMVLAYIMEMLSANASAIFFWLKVEYLFFYTPALWLLFVLVYTGTIDRITPPALLLFLPSTIQTLATWTNAYHHLNWATVGTIEVDGLVVFHRTYGPVFVLAGIYYFALVAIMFAITLRALVHAPRPYQNQLSLMLMAISFPLAAFIITTLDLSPLPYFDVMPVGWILAYLCMGWGLLRFRLLDLIPPARSIIMNSITDAILVLDTQDRVLDINRTGERLIGLQAAALIGQRAHVALAGLPGLLEGYEEAISVARTEIEVERQGVPHVFDMRISPINAGKRLRGRVVVLRDVTDRKRAEETIRRYATELERRNNELDAFTHTVAHDLKTPLQIIVGYTELLDDSDGHVISAEGKEYLLYLQESATQMRDMIGEMLLLAQLRNPDMVLVNVNAELAVRAAVARSHDTIMQRSIEVVVVPPLPPAHAHPVWFEEIMANLIGNAIKYIGRDNLAPRVEIRGSLDGRRVRYDVIDNGLGIAPENLDRLFEMFTRFHTDQASGSGIGLSIVQRIVNRLHGEIRVESTPGKGSTFSIFLPAADSTSAIASMLEVAAAESADRSLTLMA
ncbi:sensor histidine kinase [Aggregatilinea lenta]|uniref:sensor histidine kinase n=1 Tax=Aggregatilinea lenta TaxID=913108 RepID=UPI0013C37B6A|nr:histidine kinase N-terminal 7TM domain-containing protein [Aggregatilinea lenta]